MMTILNALRASPQTLGPFDGPGDGGARRRRRRKDAAINLFFREKAFWQFGRGNDSATCAG